MAPEPRTRRSSLTTTALMAAFTVVAVGIATQAYGDAQVASSIWATTGDPGFGDGYEVGHDTSAFGDLLVVVGGLGFAIAAGATRRIRPALAVLAGVLTVIPPPFFWPAVGVLFVMLHNLTTDQRPRNEPAPAFPG